MIRPATKHGLELLGGAVAVLALAGLAFAVLLARGPISLDFLTPSLSRLLSDEQGGIEVAVRGAELHWSQSERALQLQVRDVEVRDRTGLPVAAIPALDVGLSLAALREARFAPTRVRIVEAQVDLHRNEAGEISAANGGGQSEGAAGIMPLVLAWLTDDPSAGRVSAYLNEILIDRAHLVFTDARTGVRVEAPNARLNLVRTQDGVLGELLATAHMADETFDLTLEIAYDKAGRQGHADARFSPVRVSHLAPLSNFFAPLAIFDLPVGGVASLALGPAGIVKEAQVSLEGGAGNFVLPLRGMGALPVERASLNATYYPRTGHVDVEWFNVAGEHVRGELSGMGRVDLAETAPLRALAGRVDLTGRDMFLDLPELFDEPAEIGALAAALDLRFEDPWSATLEAIDLDLMGAGLALTGLIEQRESGLHIRLDGDVREFEAANLGRYWPHGVVQPARDWVVPHVHSGRLTQGTLHVDATLEELTRKPIPDGALRFDFAVEEGVASYVTGLPPLTGAEAVIRLTGQTFNLDLKKANILGTQLEGGRVVMNALGVKGTPIDITAQGQGPVDDLMRIVDAEPLGFISAYGASPADFGGMAKLDFAMTIPQKSDIAADEIEFDVKADATQLKLPAFAGLTLDRGKAAVTVTERGLVGKGTVLVNGAGADIQYEERFRGRGATPSSYHISASLDDGARAALGFDTGDYLVGTVPIAVKAKGNGTKITEVEATLDLTETAIDIGPVGYAKPAGIAVKYHVEGGSSEAGGLEISRMGLFGGGLAVSGSALLGPDGRLLSSQFPQIKIPGVADLSAETGRTADGALTVSVDGRQLNLGPLLKEGLKAGGKGVKSPWQFDARIATVELRKSVTALGLAARVESSGDALQFVDVTGRIDGGAEFYTALSETREGLRRMTLSSADAGRIVRGLTGVEAIDGGRMTLNVRLRDRAELTRQAAADAPSVPAAQSEQDVSAAAPNDAALLAKTGDGRISGTLQMDDFVVVDLPILARLLNIGSLQGMSDLMQGEGITFTRLDMPFWMDDGLLGIDDGRAAGPAIGLTVQGVVDQRRELADLRGSIVPAYAVNSVLGYVPLVGPLLVSRKGEGVFGFTYGVDGPLAEPQLTVNPLSALAPGFLRRLFEMGEAEARRVPAPREAPAAAQ